MSQTTEREERRSALDDFASGQTGQQMVESVTQIMPTQQVTGAQAVAVHRDERAVLTKLRALAAAAGDDWYYRFPVKNRKTGTTDFIEGPSIKLANDLARLYGNCEVDCRAQDLGKVILFHARFIDLETGYALTRPFQQRKSAAKIGGSDDERREDIAFQIGASKAIRNVTVNALQTFADFAFDEAKQALVDKIGKDLDKYRRVTAERTSALVDIGRVEKVIGRTVAEWLAPDVAKVIAMMKAVADGMASLDETFPPLGKVEDAEVEELDERQVNSSLDQFAGDVVGQAAGTSAPGKAADDTVPPAQTTPNPSPAAAPLQHELIAKMLHVATDAALDVQERLEVMDDARQHWEEVLPDHRDFIATVLKTCANVAAEKMNAKNASDYLQALIK